MKKISIIIFAAVIIFAGVFLFRQKILSLFPKHPVTYVQEIKDVVVPPKEEIIKQEIIDANGEVAKKEEITIPGKILVKVPFTSQAPFGIWDERREEACEEASLVMLNAYLSGKKGLTRDEAEKEIQQIIDYEIKNFGGYKDSDTEETIKLAEGFYNPPAGGKNLKAVYDFNKIELKKELAKGNPIIIPAAGRELGNPNFKQPGPLYHMLVLTGYSGDEIITNDPGTRKGEGYRYDIDVLYGAIHDFPGDKNRILEGRKAMIVIE
jgi:hypothetical protein